MSEKETNESRLYGQPYYPPSVPPHTETDEASYDSFGEIGDDGIESDGEINGGYDGNAGTGYLTVSVRTADGAIPLADALVIVRQGGRENGEVDAEGNAEGNAKGNVIIAVTTDDSGFTPKLHLPAPPRFYSESPGGPRPYAEYSLEVTKEGYGSGVYVNVPVFDGINSFQTAILVPLPENYVNGTGGIDAVRSFGAVREGGPDRTGGIG